MPAYSPQDLAEIQAIDGGGGTSQGYSPQDLAEISQINAGVSNQSPAMAPQQAGPQIPATNDFLANFSKGVSTVNLAVGSVANPAIDSFTGGLTNFRQGDQQQALKTYPNIATDTGLLGQAYQLHQNPALNFAGSVLGAFGQTANIARALPQTMGRLARNIIPAAGYSVPSNVVSVAKGEQTPLQGLFNAGSDIALSPFGGNSRIKNALIQGAGGYGQGYLSANLGGANPQQANQQALLQAALGLGMGAALPNAPQKQAIPQPTMQYKGRPVSRAYQPTGTVLPAIKDVPLPSQNIVSLNERSAMNRQIGAVDKEYAALQNLKKTGYLNPVSGQPDKVLQARAQIREKQILREYDKLTTQSRIMKGKTAQQKRAESLEAYQARLNAAVDAKTKISEAITKNKADLANVQAEAKSKVEALKAQVQQGKLSVAEATAQGRVLTEQAKQQTARLQAESKILAEKERQQTAVKQGEQRVKTAQELADIKARSKAQTEKTIKRAQAEGNEPTQRPDAMRRLIRKAVDENKLVVIEYEAQGGNFGKGGETEAANYRFKRDTVVEATHENKQGELQIKVINNEGQLRTRLFGDNSGGSRIASVTKTSEDAPYRLENGQVIDTRTNQVVEQIKQDAYFSKDIESRLERMEGVPELKAAAKTLRETGKVGEIVEASKQVGNEPLEETLAIEQEKSYKDSTEDPSSTIIEKTTGDNPC